jgi:hypothetical protein
VTGACGSPRYRASRFVALPARGPPAPRLENEKDRVAARSSTIGADGAESNLLHRILRRPQTDTAAAPRTCAPYGWPRSTASSPAWGVGDGLQPSQPHHFAPSTESRAMSHVAIAAALALDDVSAGERLVAFSSSSFANREHRAWPGTRVAAVRAGLSRSQYLAARDRLVERGLVVVTDPGGGRGNSPVVLATSAAGSRPAMRSTSQTPSGGRRRRGQRRGAARAGVG